MKKEKQKEPDQLEEFKKTILTLQGMMVVIMFLLAVGLIIGFCLHLFSDGEEGKALGYTETHQDGTVIEGTAPKFKIVEMELDGELHKIRIPFICLPLKEGEEIVIKTPEGEIKTFRWHSNQGSQP